MRFKRALLLIFIIVWLLALYSAAILKITSDGFHSYFMHFTNWNWTIHIIFFSSELYALFTGHEWHRIINLIVFFWIVNGTSWLVFWLVFLMIRDNPDAILGLIKEKGGPYEAWVVLDGHALSHVLIIVTLLVYSMLVWRHLIDGVIFMVGRKIRSRAFALASMMLYPLLIIGLYITFFDFQTIYGLSTHLAWIMLLAVAVVLIFNVLPVFLIMMRYKRTKTSLFLKRLK